MSAENVESQLAEMKSMMNEMSDALRGLQGKPIAPRSSYTVKEAAVLVGRAPYTVRQWCLEWQINASKRAEQRGRAGVWNISAEEIERYRNEGLLPSVSAQRAD